ncbi:MAG TPA: trypsin-like peptidase domain-containing protein, partial [Methanotrichaceae archaeon]|nr:trypsin-like peptidase domain-containing protein [Methanotrichaceae archaeon]
MVDPTLKAEQQQNATDRFYSRQQIREAARLPDAEAARPGIKAAIETQPTERRLIFLDPADGLARERLIGKSDLLGINYLELGLLAARSVCRIQIVNPFGRIEGHGTGFLVAPNLLITNNHVLEKADMAVKSFAEFDFEDGVNARRKPTKAFDLRPDEVFVTDRERDFTLISVAPISSDGTPLTNYGILRLVEETGKVQLSECVSAIQHPDGGLKQCCLRENEVVDIFDDWIHYLTDTQPGSSGSPVFNDQWLVVALHHSGVPKRDSQGNILRTDGQPYRKGIDHPSTIAWVANEGVRISRIFQALDARSAAEPMVAEALRRLRSTGTGPTGPAVITTPPAVPGGVPIEVDELSAEHFRSAEGYSHDFLGPGHHLPLPTLATHLQSKVAKLIGGGDVLTYHHFSIVMNAERRLAFYTAVNVDGRQLQRIARGSDKWYFDPR